MSIEDFKKLLDKELTNTTLVLNKKLDNISDKLNRVLNEIEILHSRLDKF